MGIESTEVFMQMEEWKRFGPKKVHNLLNDIEESKEQPPHVLVSGLGIPSVGKRTAQLLLQHSDNSITVCLVLTPAAA